jgi:flagellar FliL protein
LTADVGSTHFVNAVSDEAEAPAAHAKAPEASGHRVPPTFVDLEPFTVNLAYKDMERYAQVGVTLEVDDAKFAEEMKAYMPSIPRWPSSSTRCPYV